MDLPAPATAIDRPRSRPFYAQLWFLVLLAMAIGIALGHYWPDAGVRMEPLGEAFVRAIRVLIAPIIFCTVVHGIAGMASMAKVGRVALKALIYFEVLTTIALVIGLVAVNLLQPGAGMHVDLSHLDTSAVAQYLEQTRQTHHRAVSAQHHPQHLRQRLQRRQRAPGSVRLGTVRICAQRDGEDGQTAQRPYRDGGADVFPHRCHRDVGGPDRRVWRHRFHRWQVRRGLALSLGKLVIGFYVTCLFFVFAVLWPICHWCGFSLLRFIRYIREELLIVIATTSSETVLPRMIAKLEALGCEESVVGLVIPTGYSFNLDGTCLYLATAAVFLAQATDTPLGLEQQIGLLAVLLLASKGAAGVAGAAFIVLAATLASVGTISVESVALVLGVHRLLSQGLTPTNLIGNGVATLVVAKWEGALDGKRLEAGLAGDAALRA